MRQRTLRILVADDHALMRDAVRLALDGAGGIEVVAEAETAAQVVERARAVAPDVVLLDLLLPGAEGLSCLDAVRRCCPDAAVVVFTGADDRELLRTALARGAAAVVLKQINPADLAAVIRQAVERTFFQQDDTVTLPDRVALSAKELEVLEQLVLGRSNHEIARALWISDQTVKFHLRNIYRKLGASGRTEGIRIAHERGLVAPAP